MDVIQLFYTGTDGHIWTRWRRSDGAWTEERTIYGSPGSGIAAAAVPGADIFQLFYKGATDNKIYTRWRNAQGIWSGEQSISASVSGTPIAVQVPGSNVLQIFYKGTDSGLDTIFRNTDGSWSSEQHLGGTLSGDPAAAQVPGTNVLQLFYRGTGNCLYTRWRNTDGSWSPEQSLGGTLLNGNPIAAQVPDANMLQIFYRGADNGVYTRWRNPDGSWSTEQSLGGVLNGDPIAAQIPGSNVLQLFYRGTDNSIYSRWRNTDGSWSTETHIGGTLNDDPVAVQVPGANVLQLFYRGTDNSIYSLWRNADGSWSSETKIGGALNAGPIAVSLATPTPATYTLVLMLWGPPQLPGQTKWTSSLTAADLGSAMTTIAASTYFSSLAQYAVTQVTVASADPPQLSTPKLPAGNTRFTTLFSVSTDIANVVTTSIKNGAVPSPDTFGDNIPVYIVITPRGGSATDATNSLGEHMTTSWGSSNEILIYAYAGAQSDLNDTLNVVTHELVEAIGENSDAPKELCDDCLTKYGGGVSPGIGTYTVASYFDDNTNQCVAPPNFAKPAS
jgi:hypothetical protein